MKTQNAWVHHASQRRGYRQYEVTGSVTSEPSINTCGSQKDEQPWFSPRTVYEQFERQEYHTLKDRLASVPSRSKHKRQKLYIDLWTGQHWLGLTLSSPDGLGILKPVSVDTALSIATIGNYRLVDQNLISQRL